MSCLYINTCGYNDFGKVSCKLPTVDAGGIEPTIYTNYVLADRCSKTARAVNYFRKKVFHNRCLINAPPRPVSTFYTPSQHISLTTTKKTLTSIFFHATLQYHKKYYEGLLFLRHFNPYYASGFFLYPLEKSETQGILMFSGGIEREQWHEMGNEE